MGGIISWILFGALAGWAASVLTGAKQQGCLTNVVIGIVGAFIGGFIIEALTDRYQHQLWLGLAQLWRGGLRLRHPVSYHRCRNA